MGTSRAVRISRLRVGFPASGCVGRSTRRPPGPGRGRLTGSLVFVSSGADHDDHDRVRVLGNRPSRLKLEKARGRSVAVKARGRSVAVRAPPCHTPVAQWHWTHWTPPLAGRGGGASRDGPSDSDTPHSSGVTGTARVCTGVHTGLGGPAAALPAAVRLPVAPGTSTSSLAVLLLEPRTLRASVHGPWGRMG